MLTASLASARIVRLSCRWRGSFAVTLCRTRHMASAHARVEAATYLTAAQAQAVDDELMSAAHGFSLDQLMELAGLSVACAIAEVYPPATHRRVLVLAGPGNNGGDGLVAARHLHHFGYTPAVCLPKRTDKPLYHGLAKQLECLRIAFLSPEDLQSEPLVGRCVMPQQTSWLTHAFQRCAFTVRSHGDD
jgi:YjeF-related protein N-terminus